ncbi:hypothetical protein [Chroogloeocystis siderophila]|uniref:Uncharacterized protein n=1 Tax=Chroogloeocystis siderophila 5.2 s.c.1 TaxID=247279 RepID=A0A1U7HWZ0_9CHRO|nr:hypothetical protein [Chroogloeocystis siderophila]OKH28098.1 hypothetical protein NIES1031_05865 [Chroogloeocystis siderophila 5.2 s.c.1]
MKRKRSLSLLLTALGVMCLVVLGSGRHNLTQFAFRQPPAIAHSVRISDAWQQVYQQLPDLPLENQYINRQTGKLDPENTLVRRLISYHTFVKGRPPNYRLDWKLTLADYLGANEWIREASYPGHDTLRQNPLEGDRAAIQRLNRDQRNALVQALVNVFSSVSQTTPNTPPEAQQNP